MRGLDQQVEQLYQILGDRINIEYVDKNSTIKDQVT